MSMSTINPTRIELKRCKTRLTSAKSGHKLLKDKADEMIRQFLALINDTKNKRIEVEKQLSDALKNFALARANTNGAILENATKDSTGNFSVGVGLKSIMGVDTPVFKVDAAFKHTLPYTFGAAPVELDDAILNFYAVIGKLLELAELEKTCALLAGEIEKTRRRVNALEHIMIPELEKTINFIQLKLDENERGALVRLMKVKSKLEKE